METVSKNLENDHVHILRLIDVMDQLTTLQNPNVGHLEEVVYLIKNFADIFHHGKEENMFFPLLIEKGFSANQGPVSVMLHEHAAGRKFVNGMECNIILYQNGDASSLQAIKENMKGYIDLLRGHIAKENNVLFPMAANVLTVDESKDLLKRFKDFEESSVCGNTHENCLKRLDNLAKVYNL
jgi:hemerythrin-like domain-containing protein